MITERDALEKQAELLRKAEKAPAKTAEKFMKLASSWAHLAYSLHEVENPEVVSPKDESKET